MGQLIVNSQLGWNNRLRTISLFVDNNKVGEVQKEEQKVFVIPEGTHRLRAKMEIWKSPEVEIDVNHQVNIDVKVDRKMNLLFRLMGLSTLILITTATLKKNGLITSNIWLWVGIAIAIPILTIVLYNLFFRRDKYLLLVVS